MIILAHRGVWEHKAQKNSLKAFELAFRNGFGIETDIRDYKGELVISHDIPSKKSISIELLFKLYKDSKVDTPLALNIKSDGLVKLLKEKLKHYSIKNYFLFDMSIPDTISYIKAGMNIYLRESEYEDINNLYPNALGIWMDQFNTNWISKENIEFHLNNNKFISIVSPELHNREYKKSWEEYKKIDKNSNKVMICTDYPNEAKEFFSV